MPHSLSLAELGAWLRLSLEPGVGPVGARELLTAFGQPERLYGLSEGELREKLPPALAAQLAAPLSPSTQTSLARALAWADGPDHHLLTLADPAYPRALLDSHDPPVLLYVVGRPDLLCRPALAVVGARHATLDGLDHAHAFARHLARDGWTIVSGLALGIDAAAHEGALAAGGDGGGTLAIMGTGVDVVYPARHRALAARIAAGGALVSELPLGTPAIAHQFPRRNRLVAGLSLGVLVVEAAVHSGSLITARLAADAGREVFAIPGSIHSPLSRGCHALLRQGAKLVETAQDIAEELDGRLHATPSSPSPGVLAWTPPGRTTPQRTLWDNVPSPPEPHENSALTRAAEPQALPEAEFVGAAGTAKPRPASDVSDIADTATDTRSARRRRPPPLAVAERGDPVLAALGYGPVAYDVLLARTGLAPQALLARLLELDLAGRVARLPGGRYQANHARPPDR